MREITAAFDRYQIPWQAALDELAAAGGVATAAPPLRLLMLGMLNWTHTWLKPGAGMSRDEVADMAARTILTAAA